MVAIAVLLGLTLITVPLATMSDSGSSGGGSSPKTSSSYVAPSSSPLKNSSSVDNNFNERLKNNVKNPINNKLDKDAIYNMAINDDKNHFFTNEEKLQNYIVNKVEPIDKKIGEFFAELKKLPPTEAKNKNDRDSILSAIKAGLTKVNEEVNKLDSTNPWEANIKRIKEQLTKIENVPSGSSKENYEKELLELNKIFNDFNKVVNIQKQKVIRDIQTRKKIIEERQKEQLRVEEEKARKKSEEEQRRILAEQQRLAKEQNEQKMLAEQRILTERQKQLAEQQEKERIEKEQKEKEHLRKIELERKKKADELKAKQLAEQQEKERIEKEQKEKERLRKIELEEKKKADELKVKKAVEKKKALTKKKAEILAKEKELADKKQKELEANRKKKEIEKQKIDSLSKKFDEWFEQCKYTYDNSGVAKPIFDETFRSKKNTWIKLDKEHLLEAISEAGWNLKSSGALKTAQWSELCKLKGLVKECFKNLNSNDVDISEEYRALFTKYRNAYHVNGETEINLKERGTRLFSDNDKQMFDDFLKLPRDKARSTITNKGRQIVQGSDSDKIWKFQALTRLANELELYYNSHPIENEDDSKKEELPIESNILKQGSVIEEIPTGRRLPAEISIDDSRYMEISNAQQALDLLEFEISGSLQEFLDCPQFNNCCSNLQTIDDLYKTRDWKDSSNRKNMEVYLKYLTDLFSNKNEYTMCVARVFRILCAVTGQKPFGETAVSEHFDDLMNYLNSDLGKNDLECILKILDKSQTMMNLAMSWLMIQESSSFESKVIAPFSVVKYSDKFQFNLSKEELDLAWKNQLQDQKAECVTFLNFRWITELKKQGFTAERISEMTLDELSKNLKLKISNNKCNLSESEVRSAFDDNISYTNDLELSELRSIILTTVKKLKDKSVEEIKIVYDLDQDLERPKENQFIDSIKYRLIEYLKNKCNKDLNTVLSDCKELPAFFNIDNNLTDDEVNDILINKLQIPDNLLQNYPENQKRKNLLKKAFDLIKNTDQRSIKGIYDLTKMALLEKCGNVENVQPKSSYDREACALSEKISRDIGDPKERVAKYLRGRPEELNYVNETLSYYLLSYEFRTGIYKNGFDITENIFNQFKEVRNNCISQGKWKEEWFWDGLINYENGSYTSDIKNMREQTPTVIMVEKYLSLKNNLNKFKQSKIANTLLNKAWSFIADFWGPIIGSFFGKASVDADNAINDGLDTFVGKAFMYGETPHGQIINKTMFWGDTAAENWFRKHYKDSLVTDPLFQTSVFSYLKYRSCLYKKYNASIEISNAYEKYKKYDFYKNGIFNSFQKAKSIQAFIKNEKINNADNLKNEKKFSNYCIGTSFDINANNGELILKDLDIYKELEIEETNKKLTDIQEQFSKIGNENKKLFDIISENMPNNKNKNIHFTSRRTYWERNLKTLVNLPKEKIGQMCSTENERAKIIDKFKNVEWDELLNKIHRYEQDLSSEIKQAETFIKNIRINKQQLLSYEQSLKNVVNIQNCLNIASSLQGQLYNSMYQQNLLLMSNKNFATQINRLIQQNSGFSMPLYLYNTIYSLPNLYSQSERKWIDTVQSIINQNFYQPMIKNQILNMMRSYNANYNLWFNLRDQIAQIKIQINTNNNCYNQALDKFCMDYNIPTNIPNMGKNNLIWLNNKINMELTNLNNLVIQKRIQCNETDLEKVMQKANGIHNFISLLKELALQTLKLPPVNPDDAKWAELAPPAGASDIEKAFYETFKVEENEKHVFDINSEDDKALIGDMSKQTESEQLTNYLNYFVSTINDNINEAGDDQLLKNALNAKLRAIRKLVDNLKTLLNMDALRIDGLDDIQQLNNVENNNDGNELANNDEIGAYKQNIEQNYGSNSNAPEWKKMVADLTTRWCHFVVNGNQDDGRYTFNTKDDLDFIKMCLNSGSFDELNHHLSVKYLACNNKLKEKNMSINNYNDQALDGDIDTQKAYWTMYAIGGIVESLNSSVIPELGINPNVPNTNKFDVNSWIN